MISFSTPTTDAIFFYIPSVTEFSPFYKFRDHNRSHRLSNTATMVADLIQYNFQFYMTTATLVAVIV